MPANPNNQIILDTTGERSPNHPYAVICRMRCQDCGHEYGANSCDAHNRGCPRCQGKAAGFDVEPQPRKSIVPEYAVKVTRRVTTRSTAVIHVKSANALTAKLDALAKVYTVPEDGWQNDGDREVSYRTGDNNGGEPATT